MCWFSHVDRRWDQLLSVFGGKCAVGIKVCHEPIFFVFIWLPMYLTF